MAITHIKFDANTNHGRLLRRSLQQIEEAHEEVPKLLETMSLMIDGDGSQESHFSNYILEAFGFGSAADAKACYDELNSYNFKQQTNAQVDNVYAATRQLLAKLRG